MRFEQLDHAFVMPLTLAKLECAHEIIARFEVVDRTFDGPFDFVAMAPLGVLPCAEGAKARQYGPAIVAGSEEVGIAEEHVAHGLGVFGCEQGVEQVVVDFFEQGHQE